MAFVPLILGVAALAGVIGLFQEKDGNKSNDEIPPLLPNPEAIAELLDSGEKHVIIPPLDETQNKD